MVSYSINGTVLASAMTTVLLLVPSVVAAQTFEELNIMAPAAPGGGWDGTARAMQQVLQETGLVSNVQVTNVPGAGGAVGLAQFVDGGPNDMMVAGAVMVGALLSQNSEVTLDEVTPVARLIGEYSVIVVPAASEFETIDDLMEAFRADPGAVALAGGSAGGIDHILAIQLAQAAGVAPSDVNYIAHAGGGEALAALFANDVAAGMSGYGEWAGQIEAGELRALAISAPERLDGVDIPTLIEQGIDVEIVNWRGVFGPGGLTDEQRQAQIDLIDQMVATEEWQQLVEERSWIDVYLPGDEFSDYLAEDKERIEGVLREVGLVN